MAALEKFEIVPFGPYRFIGKSAYARAWKESSEEIWWGVWKNSGWVFNALDQLKEYASDEIHNHAFETWDKFDSEKELMGYVVGRFMKAGTPVPEGMEFIDIPVMTIAKGWGRCAGEELAKALVSGSYADDSFFAKVEDAKCRTFDAIAQTNYSEACWKLTAKTFPVGFPHNSVSDENDKYAFGAYIGCIEKKKKKWYQRKRGK